VSRDEVEVRDLAVYEHLSIMGAATLSEAA
jgi:hypothetical protein